MLYFYDGSPAGFLTAFLQAFTDENAVLCSHASQLHLGETSVYVQTDEGRAIRAKERLRSFDKNFPHELSFLLRSGEAGAEQTAFLYFRLLAERKRPVSQMLTSETVFRAREIIKRVGFEIHRFHGFIRFTECANGALYAPFAPDNDICDLLAPHFRARFPTYPFVIHDIKRKKAVFYDGKNTFIAPLQEASVVLSANEDNYQALWKEYYKSVNIPSRAREKQMRGYMPVRYWQFLTEL